MGAISTLSANLRVCVTLRFTQIRNHHPLQPLLCAARLFEVVACVYTSSVILLLACRKSSCTVFTSSPLALSSVPKVWRKVCQPIRL